MKIAELYFPANLLKIEKIGISTYNESTNFVSR